MNIVINLNMAYISIQAAHKFISSARHKFRTPFKYVLWTWRGWPRILSPHCEKVCAPRAFAVITENFLPLPKQNDKIVSRGIKFAHGVWRWHYKRMFALPCKHAVSQHTLFFICVTRSWEILFFTIFLYILEKTGINFYVTLRPFCERNILFGYANAPAELVYYKCFTTKVTFFRLHLLTESYKKILWKKESLKNA